MRQHTVRVAFGFAFTFISSMPFALSLAVAGCGGGSDTPTHDLSLGGGGGGGDDDLGAGDDMPGGSGDMALVAIPNYPLRDLLNDAPYLDTNASYRFRISSAGSGWAVIGLAVPRTVAAPRIQLWASDGTYLGSSSNGWTCDSTSAMSVNRTLFLAFNGAKRGAQSYYAVIDAGGAQYSVEYYEATQKLPSTNGGTCGATDEACANLPSGHVAHAFNLDMKSGDAYSIKHDESCGCSSSTAQTFQFVIDSGGLRGDVGSSETYQYVAAQCGKCGSDQAGVAADPGSDVSHGVILIDTTGPTRGTVNVCYQVQATSCAMPENLCSAACVDPQTTTTACGASCTNCNSVLLNSTGHKCAAAACDYTACTDPYIDCDGNRANGCEKPCFGLNATGLKCAGTSCDYTTCNANFADCNGTRVDGCEHQGDGCPSQLVPSGTGISFSLAVDATYVYWANGTTINRAPKATQGLVEPIVTGASGTINRLAIDSSYVYFTAGSEVDRAPIGGGGPITTLQPAQSGPVGIFVDANNYYWTNTGSHTVMMQAFAGGSPVTVATMTAAMPGASPGTVVADATNAYWTSADGTVWQAPLTGAGPVIRLDQPATNGGGDASIAVDGTSVYWPAPTNGVYKNLIGAGNEVAFVGVNGGAYHGLAIDATHVFYSTGQGVYSTTKDNVTHTVVDLGSSAVALAIDATYVYWNDGNIIWKALK